MLVATENDKLKRDTRSNALINNDADGFRLHQQLRAIVKKQTELESVINSLRQQMQTITNKLTKLEQNG